MLPYTPCVTLFPTNNQNEVSQSITSTDNTMTRYSPRPANYGLLCWLHSSGISLFAALSLTKPVWKPIQWLHRQHLGWRIVVSDRLSIHHNCGGKRIALRKNTSWLYTSHWVLTQISWFDSIQFWSFFRLEELML